MNNHGLHFPDTNRETHSGGQDLTEKQLMKVAQTLGQEWEQVAIHLELETKDLENIKAEHSSVAMRQQNMLVRWKRLRPGNATAQDLLSSLEDLQNLPCRTRYLLQGNVLHPVWRSCHVELDGLLRIFCISIK